MAFGLISRIKSLVGVARPATAWANLAVEAIPPGQLASVTLLRMPATEPYVSIALGMPAPGLAGGRLQQVQTIAVASMLENPQNEVLRPLVERLTELQGGISCLDVGEYLEICVVSPQAVAEEVARVAGDILAIATFDQDVLTAATARIGEQIAQFRRDPKTPLLEAYCARITGGDEARRVVLPFGDVAPPIDVAEAHEWAEATIAKPRMRALVSGPLDGALAGRLIELVTKGAGTGAWVSSEPTEAAADIRGAGVVVRIAAAEGVDRVLVGGAAVLRSNRGSFIRSLAATMILAGDERSRLMRDLRRDHGAIYDLEIERHDLAIRSFIYIAASTDGGAGEQISQRVMAQIEELDEDGARPEEVAHALGLLRGDIGRFLSDPIARARRMLAFKMWGWSDADIGEYPDALTVETIDGKGLATHLFGGPPVLILSEAQRRA